MSIEMPPPQSGPRHYVIMRSGVICSVQLRTKGAQRATWRVFLTRAEAVEAVRESDYPKSTTIVDVGSVPRKRVVHPCASHTKSYEPNCAACRAYARSL